MHYVSRVDEPDSDAPVAGRRDRGVVELGLRGFDRGDVGGDRGLELIDLGLVQVDLLLRSVIFLRQRLGADESFSAAMSWASS